PNQGLAPLDFALLWMACGSRGLGLMRHLAQRVVLNKLRSVRPGAAFRGSRALPMPTWKKMFRHSLRSTRRRLLPVLKRTRLVDTRDAFTGASQQFACPVT